MSPPPDGLRKAVFALAEGDVTVTFPEGLPADSVEDLASYIGVWLKGLQREAGIADKKPDKVEAKLADLAYPEQPEAAVLPKPEKVRRRWDELPPSHQAAIRCREPSFRKFLAEQTGAIAALEMAEAITVVRHRCDNVTTRAMIKPGTEAARRWHDLEKEFQAWLSMPA